LQYSENAAAYFVMTSGVRVEPTTPRIPEILTMSDKENLAKSAAI
jgi:hypothetical protein